MRLHVIHETHYQYASPVVLSQQLLHLAPRALPWQACHAHRLSVKPEPGELSERDDFFGNPTSLFLIAAPHAELVGHSASTLSVSPREQASLARPRAGWEAGRAEARTRAAGGLY
jgi:transglutaminase-like putative cysteine protease